MTEIRVDDADDRCTCRGEAFDHRGTEPEFACTVQHFDPVSEGELVSQHAGAVRRVVVNDDDLPLDTGGPARRENCFNEILQAIAFVVGWHHDRQRGGLWGGSGQGWNSPAL